MLNKFIALLLLLALPFTANAAYDVFLSQPAHSFLAAPTGGAGNLAPRTIVSSDLPALPYAPSALATGHFFVGVAGVATDQTSAQATAALDQFTSLLQGLVPASGGGSTNYLRADGTWAAPAGGGSVTSVAMTVPAEFSVAGSPITGAGTLAVTKANQNANLVYAGPSSGGAAAPTFRSLAAADIPALSYAPSALTTGHFFVGVAGVATDQTGAQATAALVDFTGDSGAGGVKGLVPAPAAGDAAANKYLKADGTWATVAGGGGGTVTSVALSAPAIFSVGGSPVTGSGTLALSLATQNANLVWAGPSSGGAATPTFRSLAAADIPALPYASDSLATNNFYIGVAGVATARTGTQATALLDNFVGDSGAGGTKGIVPAPAAGDAAANKYLKADGTWAVVGGGGTVTSVALAAPAEFSVSGSPVTGSGTLTFSKANQNANLIYAGPSSGGAAAPTFRSMVAADIPNAGVTGQALTGFSASAGTVAATDTILQAFNKIVGNFVAYKETVQAAGTCSTSYNVDPNSGTMVTLTLSGACAIGVTGLSVGNSFTLQLTQSSTTAPTFSGAFKWSQGITPTFSTSATKYDTVSCVSFDGTNLMCGALIDVR